MKMMMKKRKIYQESNYDAILFVAINDANFAQNNFNLLIVKGLTYQ